MGERGRVVHLRRTGVALLRTDFSGTVLGHNTRWTSLVPADGADFDPEALAAAEGADVAQIWFDDDAGVTLQVAGVDGFAGELSVPFFEEDVSGVEDERFVDALAARDLLKPAAARTLKARLKDPAAKRDDWVRAHGVEEAFGFPTAEVLPVKPAPARASASPSEDDWTQPLPRRYRLPAEARPTLDLHVFYWTDVWSMNSWTLSNRYKKHLPAADRGLVDELCNAAAMGNADEIPSRVEHILQKTWQAEDWATFIRSPKLDDSGTDDDTARRWRQLTGRE